MVFPQLALSRAILRSVSPHVRPRQLKLARGKFDPYELFPVRFIWNEYKNSVDDTVVDVHAIEHYYTDYRYQELGLHYEDCVNEEHPIVREAISRLPKEVQEARRQRIDRAIILLTSKKTLPEDLHTLPENDIPYLAPYIAWVEAEAEEYDAFIAEQEDISLPPSRSVTIADYDNHSGVRRITKIRLNDSHDHGYKVSKSTSGYWWH